MTTIFCLKQQLVCCVLFFFISSLQAQPLTREQQQTVSQAFVTAVNNQDIDKLGSLINMQALGERVANAAISDPQLKKEFLNGFTSQQGRKNFTASSMMSMQQNTMTAHFRGFIEEEGRALPLVRLDIEDGGFEYLLFEFERPGTLENGNIADFYVASSGKWQSEQIADATRLMLPNQDNWLKRLTGEAEIDQGMVETFSRLGEYRIEGKFKQAYELLMELPESTRTQRVIIDLALQLGKLYRDDAYFYQLSELAEHHSDDPSTHFMLLDYYFLIGDINGAMAITDKLIKRFGSDGPLLMIKGNLHASRGNMQETERTLQAAIDSEPEFLQSYWALVMLYLHQSRHEEVIRVLTRLQKRGIQLSKNMFRANNQYAEFITSDEFREWEL